jgi:hypothetical protein
MSINSLAVLAYKIAPNMFDLSTGLSHVSLRDQLIRGATLVRDLIAAGLLTDADELLIIGAGAAGVSAAQQASTVGCRSLLLDTADAPFGLQANVTTRYVGPYMYEWPWDIHADQQFAPHASSLLHHWNTATYAGLEVYSSAPLTAAQLASDWQSQLGAWVRAPGSKLSVLTKVDPKTSLRAVKAWRRRQRFWMPGPGTLRFDGIGWPNGIKTQALIHPRFIILAAGFGPERVTWEGPSGKIDGPRFWQSDALSQPFCGLTSAPTIVVLGGGDGALQDALRCLYPHSQPLQTLQDLLSFPGVPAAFQAAHADLLLAEQQHAATRTWTSGARAAQGSEFASLQKAYVAILETLAVNPKVQDAMLDSLRKDVARVVLVVRDKYLGKAYSLNRFLILLLAQCLEMVAAPSGKVEFQLKFNTEVTDITGLAGNRTVTVHELYSNAVTSISDVAHLSIRFGVVGDMAPGQLMGLTKKDTKNRRELANIPQSLWPLP